MKKNLIGKRFGKLVVIESTDQRKNGYMIWKCHCDCGNDILVDYRKLMCGTAMDCGCSSIKGKVDLRGRRFGKLMAIVQANKTDPKDGRIWICRCDCGAIIEIPTRHLTSGRRKSCGCLSKPPLKKYVGKKFGNLTILHYAWKKKGSHFWHCRCDCGNELDVQQSNLQNGHTTSCGCNVDIKKNIHFVNGTSVEAIRSKKLNKNNKSGVRGVYWNKKTHKWIAQITFQGKTKSLGSYQTLEEAAAVRKEKEDFLFGEFLEWYDRQEKKK